MAVYDRFLTYWMSEVSIYDVFCMLPSGSDARVGARRAEHEAKYTLFARRQLLLRVWTVLRAGAGEQGTATRGVVSCLGE